MAPAAQPPGELASAPTSAAGSNAGWREVGSGSASGGGISDDDGDSCGPSIAVASDGTPYVAWTDRNHFDKYDRDIYVRRWNGDNWEEVGAGSASGGGVSGGSGYAFAPSIAIALDGTPYIAWDNDTEIYIRYWDGDGWQEVGAGSASGGGISNTSSHYSDSGRVFLDVGEEGSYGVLLVTEQVEPAIAGGIGASVGPKGHGSRDGGGIVGRVSDYWCNCFHHSPLLIDNPGCCSQAFREISIQSGENVAGSRFR